MTKESVSYTTLKIRKVLRECEYEKTDAVELLETVIQDIKHETDDKQMSAKCTHPYYCYSCKNEWDANEWCGVCPECGSKNISYLKRKQNDIINI